MLSNLDTCSSFSNSKSWENIPDLYGQPFAGLLWERKLAHVLLEERWKKYQDGNTIPPKMISDFSVADSFFEYNLSRNNRNFMLRYFFEVIKIEIGNKIPSEVNCVRLQISFFVEPPWT